MGNLKYPDWYDLSLKGDKSEMKSLKEDLNIALKKLFDNHSMLDPDSDLIPDIWRCKWYNDYDTETIKSKGYPKGAAVWINTESIEQFTSAKSREISSIISHNPALAQTLNNLVEEDDQMQLMQFYRGIVDGSIVGSTTGQPLYYIGDVKDRIQIRVSLFDDNIALPSDDTYWKDFFQYDIVKQNEDEMNSFLSAEFSCQLSTHLVDYHLPFKTKQQERAFVSQLDTDYVKCDLGNNLTSILLQDYRSHRNTTSMYGFDFVKQMDIVRCNDCNNLKWYRLWSSGYLEQGGIVNANNITAFDDTNHGNLSVLNDITGVSFITVQLPLAYDYSTDITQKFYPAPMPSENDHIDTSDHIARDMRYNIHVTRLASNDPTKRYRAVSHGNSTTYESCTVSSIKNKSFRIVKANPGDKQFSFYVSGFLMHHTALKQQPFL